MSRPLTDWKGRDLIGANSWGFRGLEPHCQQGNWNKFFMDFLSVFIF